MYAVSKYIRGSSLLELLIGISVGSVLISALAGSLLKQTTHYYNLKQAVHIRENQTALARITERIMQELDTHPLPLYPIIHQPSKILLADGRKINTANTQSNSPAITSLQLRFDQTLQVTNMTKNFASLTTSACRINTNIPRQSPIELRQAWLIHPEFMAEMSASYTQAINNQDCYVIELRPVTGMFSYEKNLDKLALAKVIIPVEWIRTHFLDAEQHLRVLGHVGEQVIFNQPIFSKALDYTLVLEQTPVTGHKQLRFAISANSSRNFEIVMQHKVPRVEPLNLILNL